MKETNKPALTWKIGASKAFAKSVQYKVERESTGSVVKPI